MGPSLKMIIEKITSMIVISYGFKDDHIKSLPFHTHRTIFEPQRIPSARFRSKLCPDVPSSPVWSFLTQFIACVFRTKILKKSSQWTSPVCVFRKKLLKSVDICGIPIYPHICHISWKFNEVESHGIPIFFSRFPGSTAPLFKAKAPR